MTESVSPRRPIFIVGMPRSGTTLLSSLLDAHPDLVVAPETHYFTRCWTGEEVHDSADAERMLDRLFQQPGVHDMGFSDREKTQIYERVRTTDHPTHADVLGAVLEAFADRSDATIWGEKTPDHLRFIPEIARHFPTAGFVALVRDPRDVSLSLRTMPWSRGTLPAQAWTWRSYAALIERYANEYEDQFIRLRYEDLITDPDRELRALCTKLNLPFHESMLRRNRTESGAFDADREPWKEKSGRPIDPSNKGKWRTDMPDDERIIIDVIAGRWLTTYGYDRPPIEWRPSLIGRILRRLGIAALRWGRRTVQNLRRGRTLRDDASPQWMDE